MQKIIRVMMMSAALMGLVGQLALGEDQDNNEDLYHYLEGRYIVIGRVINGAKTYQGTVDLVYEKGRLGVTRKINGLVIKGEGRIEHALGTDKADVLRVRYIQDGKDYEITYVWNSDLDNYPRLSGYLYESGKKTDSPGLEALFRDHAQK